MNFAATFFSSSPFAAAKTGGGAGGGVKALRQNQFQWQNSCLCVLLAVDKNGIDALMQRVTLTKLYTLCMSGHVFVATCASILCQREYVPPPSPPLQISFSCSGKIAVYESF